MTLLEEKSTRRDASAREKQKEKKKKASQAGKSKKGWEEDLDAELQFSSLGKKSVRQASKVRRLSLQNGGDAVKTF